MVAVIAVILERFPPLKGMLSLVHDVEVLILVSSRYSSLKRIPENEYALKYIMTLINIYLSFYLFFFVA